MANVPTDDAMKARAIEAICLWPVESAQGGQECMNSLTGQTVPSSRFQPSLIAKIVMQQVERMARKQGTQSFEITTKVTHHVILLKLQE